MLTRDQHIQSIIQKTDIRSQKWEYRLILDKLQEIGECNVSELTDAINSDYDCEILTYDIVYYNLHALVKAGAVKNTVSKIFEIRPEYVTSKTPYLPLSSYCVYIFSTAVILLILSIYSNYEVRTFIAVVMTGALFIFGQILGSEFVFKDAIEKLKNTTGKLTKVQEKQSEKTTDEIAQ